jgi:hypothetical protein
MKKILYLVLFSGVFISSAYSLCSVYKDKTTCDIFGKPMCRWNEAGQCVAGNKPDAEQSTIEDKPFTYDLKRQKAKQEERSKESTDELQPPG